MEHQNEPRASSHQSSHTPAAFKTSQRPQLPNAATRLQPSNQPHARSLQNEPLCLHHAHQSSAPACAPPSRAGATNVRGSPTRIAPSCSSAPCRPRSALPSSRDSASAKSAAARLPPLGCQFIDSTTPSISLGRARRLWLRLLSAHLLLRLVPALLSLLPQLLLPLEFMALCLCLCITAIEAQWHAGSTSCREVSARRALLAGPSSLFAALR